MLAGALVRGAAVAAVLSVATACSSGATHSKSPLTGGPGNPVAATSADGRQRVTIDATNMFRFAPSVVTAHTGQLQVTLVDAGSYPHNLSVDGLHFTSPTVSGDPGQGSTTFMLMFTRPGTYSFECTFHSSAGMRGEFVIR